MARSAKEFHMNEQNASLPDWTEATSRKRLPVRRGFISEAGSANLSQNPSGAKGFAVYTRTEPSEKLGELLVENLPQSVLDKLALVGLRQIANAYLTSDTELEDIPDIFETIQDELCDGSAFEREGGFDEARFCEILGHLMDNHKGAVSLVERKKAEMSGKLVLVKRKDGTEEADAFELWVEQVRTRPEYRQKMRELYPNKGKRGRKGKTLIDLLA
jgi:hypothetical protein